MLPLAILLTCCLHPVHSSVSQIQWNDAAGRYEVSLRFDLQDEPEWNRQSDLPGADAIEYLKTHYKIDDCQYQWVGRQPEGGQVWWHFEIQPPANRESFDPLHPEITITVLATAASDNHRGAMHHRLNVAIVDDWNANEFTAEKNRQRLNFASLEARVQRD